jgi:predicted nucleic acid-binding protein
MTFAALLRGESVFLDANTLIYHFQPHPIFGPACNQLLARIENQELLGFTSTHMLTEVAHRLMMMEASALPGWNPTKVKLRLQQQPAIFRKLSLFSKAIEAILQSRLQVLSPAAARVLDAATVSQAAGLLSSDALIVAIIQHHGLNRLASNDSDFDRVPGLLRYAPV